jgi:hypothetical protein
VHGASGGAAYGGHPRAHGAQGGQAGVQLLQAAECGVVAGCVRGDQLDGERWPRTAWATGSLPRQVRVREGRLADFRAALVADGVEVEWPRLSGC